MWYFSKPVYTPAVRHAYSGRRCYGTPSCTK